MLSTPGNRIAPATVKRTVAPPRRRPNAELRPREHLTEREVEKLIEAAKGNRWGQRDSTMILIWPSGMACGPRRCANCSGATSSLRPALCTCAEPRAGQRQRIRLLGDELRALRALKREAKSPFIFVSRAWRAILGSGLQKMVERAGIEAKLPFKVHPHMLRHATGFALANKGTDTRTLQAYLGHRSIQSTVRYTELAPGRFKNLWR